MRWWPLLVILFLAAGLTGFGASFTHIDTNYRVSSGSMAPTLLGPHFRLTCQRCQFPAVLDATHDLPPKVTCPNCGDQQNDSAPAVRLPGDEITWEPTKLEDVRRWDLVLLEDPNNGRLTVKRVAFLPGELPQIRHGELYQGERLLRKSPQQREAQKILVFDHRHDPPQASRFQPARAAGSGWQVRPGSLGFAPIVESAFGEADWLEYHHHACLPPPSPEGQAAAPRDHYAYNHALSRRLHPVNDLWLEVSIAHWRADAFTLRLRDRQGKSATIRIDVNQNVVHWSDGQRQKALPFDLSSLQGLRLQGGVCDGQAFLQLHGPDREWYFPLGAAKMDFGPQPFALRIEGGPAILRDVQIYRDVVYLGAHLGETPWTGKEPLGENEIFVIGDNVPISDDSRFSLGSVQAEHSLRGRVVRQSR